MITIVLFIISLIIINITLTSSFIAYKLPGQHRFWIPYSLKKIVGLILSGNFALSLASVRSRVETSTTGQHQDEKGRQRTEECSFPKGEGLGGLRPWIAVDGDW